MKNKYLSKKISEGISGFLTYHFSCERGRVMNESFLLSAMADIINSNIGQGQVIKSGYVHSVINNSPKSGRKRELDYAVFDLNGNLSCVIEAKWAGSSYCTIDNILVDLFRLSLVKKCSQSIQRYFVLAGHCDAIKHLVFNGKVAPGLSNSPIHFLNTEEVKSLSSSPFFYDAINSINPSVQDIPVDIIVQLIRNGKKLPIESWGRFECFVWEVSV